MQRFDCEIKKQPIGGFEPLPAGGYVARILDAKEERGRSAQGNEWAALVISFDVAEGEYKDYFRQRYNAETYDNKKWKGTYRLNIPIVGSQYEENTKKSFGSAIACIEESNPGFKWNWNEAELKGKTCGVLYRNKEWEMNGNTGWTTECAYIADANDIRSGDFRTPKDKPLPNKPVQQNANFDNLPDDDSDLPF